MDYQFTIKMLSEIAENSLRGGLASFMQLQSNLGVAFVNALNIGHVVDWIKISWACMVVPGKYMKIHVLIGLYHLKKRTKSNKLETNYSHISPLICSLINHGTIFTTRVSTSFTE